VSKIKRAPNQGKTSEQIYYVDVDGHADAPLLKKAIEELAKHSPLVKILGTYPKTSAQV
jgi:prephenate dehydratase